MALRACILLVAAIAAAAAAGGALAQASATPFYANRFEKVPSADALTALGRALFRAPALSASGRMACTTCHDPARAFGPPDGRRVGLRAVPSLRYLQNVPAFTLHLVDDDGNDAIDQGPAGGRTWDGRVQSAHDQARIPLLSQDEMANASPSAVVWNVAHSALAASFREVFGARVFDDEALVFRGLLLALETYQQDPAEFYPYSSKYDAWLRRRTTLEPAEARGLAAFVDPARGNCARCHPGSIRHGAFPAFTDFGYVALGLPRNAALPANADPRFFDLGLCGPLRSDLEGRARYCGMFRTPSLRNVAARRVFMHNGVFHTLDDVVRFYARRDSNPGEWYPQAADGSPLKYNDLPPPYRSNVDQLPPFGRSPGAPPALSDGDVADIVAFLGTLTDGFRTR